MVGFKNYLVDSIQSSNSKMDASIVVVGSVNNTLCDGSVYR